MELSSHSASGLNKVARYGWTTKDLPGKLKMLNKDILRVDPAYQRDLVDEKVTKITAGWSWVACGAIIVGLRDGEYWVIDGQHRVMSAKRRSDIDALPCLVFETESVKQEAQGFLDANTNRKPITSAARHKAMVASGNQTAKFVQAQIDALGLFVSTNSKTAGAVKCIGLCMRRAEEDRERFARVMSLVAEMVKNEGMFVPERVIDGVWFLDANCGEGLHDKRLVQRLREKGAKSMLDAANRAAAYYARGGAKVWADGMLAELNKGLHRKFTLNTNAESCE